MDEKDIISSINQIYDRFEIPARLRLHMLRAAGVGAIIADNWKSNKIKINKEEIVASMLIHDLGNIVKFNFDLPQMAALYPAEELERLKKQKEETIKRYGTSNDEEVTIFRAKELGVPARVLHLVENESLYRLSSIPADDYEQKICTYSDLRTGPFGIISIRERLDDLRKRYGGKPQGIRYGKENENKIFEVEAEIFSNTGISPSDINDKSIGKYVTLYSGE